MKNEIQALSKIRSHHERIFYLSKLLHGNIIEIGAGVGVATCFFLQAVSNTDRIVYVIDPFESGWNEMPDSYGKPYPKQIFLTNVQEFLNESKLELIEMSSQDQQALSIVQKIKDVSLFFIDGLQYEWAVLNDITIAVSCNSQVICLDDYNRQTGVSQVPSAVKKFLSFNTQYELVHISDNRECYLIKKA